VSLERPTAAVLAVGDELIEGRLLDRNSAAISSALAELGLDVRGFTVAGDDEQELAASIAELCGRHALVVASGGLGPTLDDVVREAAARAAGVALERRQEVLDWLRGWFAGRGRAMSASNERQACFPAGAVVLPNSVGTAPGFRLQIGRGVLCALPGPPPEMRAMLEREVLPWVRATWPSSAPSARAAFYLCGIAESTFGELAGAWMERGAEPLMGVTAHTGVLAVSLQARAATRAQAESALEARRAEFRVRFGEFIYSEEQGDLALAVGRSLIERGVTLSTAESCTGGLLAARLTALPGISAVYRGGWVTYADDAKRRELGVDGELLRRHGAVSEAVARAMAAGARRESGARAALAITGVAGPGGGTPEKPVGLVFGALAFEDALEAREWRLPPVGREELRTYAVHAALDLLRRALAR
jgi:nicotinamide-nucleotide amidase